MGYDRRLAAVSCEQLDAPVAATGGAEILIGTVAATLNSGCIRRHTCVLVRTTISILTISLTHMQVIDCRPGSRTICRLGRASSGCVWYG
jgi:hypothetical protein